MDVATDPPQPHPILSYDEVDYEQQIPQPVDTNTLASRIGNTKVYLLSETAAAARSAKRKYGEDDEITFDPDKRTRETEEEMDDEDPSYRANAILLRGTPISHLPTARLFAYAKHFDTTPLGLEWVSDTTCVLVYDSKNLARTAFSLLQKSSSDLPDDEGFVTAKPIPLAFWPPEERINNTLGKGEGLKGLLQMRWARVDDVKKKGARHESQFYKKHGEDAGKDLYNGRDLPPSKKTRYENEGGNNVVDEDLEKLRLDAELDDFLRESDDEKRQGKEGSEGYKTPPEPVSKMRSDYIASDGRTLLDRFSDPTLFETDRNPAERQGLKDRLVVPLPRRARGGRGSRRRGAPEPEIDSSSSSLRERWSPAEMDLEGSREQRGGGSERDGQDYRRDGRRRGGRRGDDRPKKTQQELDDELDAFLRQD